MCSEGAIHLLWSYGAHLFETCLLYHLDEHLSGLRGIAHFPQEGNADSMHTILGFKANVEAEAIEVRNVPSVSWRPCCNVPITLIEVNERYCLWLLKKSRLVQKLPKLGDQKCIRRWRKSFIGHPSASSF
jgi:hypothetical protein